MTHKSLHHIIVTPHFPVTQVHNLPRVTKVLQGQTVSHVPHDFYRPFPPSGISAEAVLYGLGHNETLHPLEDMTPAIMRQVREFAFALRQSGGMLHVFGVLDLHSPYGSRRVLEPFVRLLQQLDMPVQLHIGVWQPTPREFATGLREIETLATHNTCIASLFPLQPVTNRNTLFTQRFIDGIIGPRNASVTQGIRLPLEDMALFSSPGVNEEDVFVVANHSLHGLDSLSHALQLAIGKQLVPLHHTHLPHPKVMELLSANKHVMGVTNRPSLHHAYFGADITHPYFESLYNPQGCELLEMLLSPHFGYHVEPYRTVVLIEEERTPQFDQLLAAYVKKLQQEQQDYHCYFIQPQSLTGSLVASNHKVETPSIHAHSHIHLHNRVRVHTHTHTYD